jgi:hypothetical protein
MAVVGEQAVPDAPPELMIGVEGVAPLAHAAVPTLQFRARLRTIGRDTVRSITLEAQIRIATDRRDYCEQDQQRLADLFGGPPGVPRSRPSLLWARASTQVPPFVGETQVELPVTCTYDFDVVAAKFLHSLSGGVVPLEFRFSGAIFYDRNGRVQAARLPAETEAAFRMPVRVWRDLMEQYFPGTAWLRLDREVFDALCAYRTECTLTSWSETVRSLLRAAGVA